MVTGGSSSGVAVAVSKVCQENKKLFMATLTYSNDTTGKDAHRYTFRETYNAWMAANALGRHLRKNFPKKKYFYVTADYTWGWTTRDSMMKFTGTEGASDVQVPLGEPIGSPHYKKAIQKALDEKAEVLVLVLFGRDMIAGLRQCIEMDVKSKMQIVVPNLEMHMAMGFPLYPTAGVLGAVPWYWEIPYKYNFEKGKQFVEAYRARYGKPPCSGGGTAYTNIMLYKWAVEQVKSFDPKPIIRALEGHSFVALKDQETMRSWDHQTLQSVYVVRGRSGDQMKSEWDVFEVIEAYQGEDLAPSEKENPVKLEPLES
jgi:ABC-type branched-subunit amino acid transport system substrate-binding protein